MDRTGKRHMARRADDCKPNLEGNLPACSAVVGVLDYKGSPANSPTLAIRLTDLRIPCFFCTNAGQTYAPFVVPHTSCPWWAPS